MNEGPARSAAELKKKWSNLCSSKKKKLASFRRELKKTGGGPAPTQLTEEDDMFLSIIGETAIGGIEGGVDSSEMPNYVTDQGRLTRPMFNINR